MSLVNAIKNIHNCMKSYSQHWKIKGIKTLSFIETYHFPFAPKKKKSQINGFDYELSYQQPTNDTGDCFMGEIFLPIGNDEFLHIEWHS